MPDVHIYINTKHKSVVPGNSSKNVSQTSGLRGLFWALDAHCRCALKGIKHNPLCSEDHMCRLQVLLSVLMAKSFTLPIQCPQSPTPPPIGPVTYCFSALSLHHWNLFMLPNPNPLKKACFSLLFSFLVLSSFLLHI